MKKSGGKLLVSVAGRLTVFLYIFSVFILSLYLLGNFQDFTDSSLIVLLEVYKYTALIYSAFALSYCYILIAEGRNTERNIGLRLFLVIAGICLSAAGYIASAILTEALQSV